MTGVQTCALPIFFSPNGMHIVSASDDHTARIWNTDTAECKHSLSLSGNSQISIVLPIFGVYIHHDSYDGIYPTRQLSFLDMHEHTIFHTINFQTLNIPPPFCMPTCVSYHLSKICLGYRSGKVLLLQVILCCTSHCFYIAHSFSLKLVSKLNL